MSGTGSSLPVYVKVMGLELDGSAFHKAFISLSTLLNVFALSKYILLDSSMCQGTSECQ